MTVGRFDLARTPLEDGITLVEASAGTGKTYSIEGVFLRLLLEGRVDDVRKILVVTFTNDATEELINRIRIRLRQAVDVFEGRPGGDEFLEALKERFGAEGLAVLREALSRIDELSIYTIHGFCKRMLEGGAFESGTPFHAEFLEDETALLEEAAYDFWRGRIYTDEFLASVAVAQGWSPDELTGHYRTWRRHPGVILLPEKGDLSASVAALEAAVGEVRSSWDRGAVEALLGADDLDWLANAKMNEADHHKWIARAHAFCGGRMSVGFEVLDYFTPAVIHGSLKVKCRGNPPDHPFFRACERVAPLLEPVWTELIAHFIEETNERFEKAKADRQILTFDDLLLRLRAALKSDTRGAAMVRSLEDRFGTALIDEFQDTDPVQCDIFTAAFERSVPLFFIGDPKQAIYAFRGADVFAYLEAKEKASRSYTLTRNFRSRTGLVKAVNAIFGRAPKAFVLKDIEFHEGVASGKADGKPLEGDDLKPFQIWFLTPKQKPKGGADTWSKDDGREIVLENFTAEIVRLLSEPHRIGEESVGPGDMAVLVRANWEARMIQERLRKAGVPSIISDTGDILRTEEMAELGRILEAILDPRDGYAVGAALATEIWGHDAAAIHELKADDERWEALAERLGRWRDAWRRSGFMPMIERFLTEENVRRRLLAFEDGERRLTNLLHAVEFLHQGAEENGLAPDGFLPWLARVRRTGPKDAERAELRLETDARAVKISTVHKAKGLEYEIVFLPFLWDCKPHGPDDPALAHDGSRLVFDHGSPDKARHDRLAEEERLAEDMRLAYVALTRAKQRCYLAWGPIGSVGNGAQLSALRYLLHPDRGDPKRARARWNQEMDKEDPKNKALFFKDIELWEGSLRDLVAANAEHMDFRLLDADAEAGVFAATATGKADLRPRAFPALAEARLAPWRMASFSSLEKGEERERPDHVDPPAPSDPVAPAPQGIFAFAKGIRAGSCLHEVFEGTDFGKLDDEMGRAEVEAVLKRFGFHDPKAHDAPIDPVRVVLEMRRRVLFAALPGADFRLADVPPSSCFPEWLFYVPLEGMVPAKISGLLERHGSPKVGVKYAPHLASLSAGAIRGFLTGFVDLVFERDGRWYIIDWKSNHLGNDASSYGWSNMEESMSDHHYVLQYHIYAFALHRYLQWRLSGGYDFEKNFGGVWYVFLRGAGAGKDAGFFFDRPSLEFVEGMSALARGGRHE